MAECVATAIAVAVTISALVYAADVVVDDGGTAAAVVVMAKCVAAAVVVVECYWCCG